MIFIQCKKDYFDSVTYIYVNIPAEATILSALQLLIDDSYIYSYVHIGTYVAMHPCIS